MPFSPCALWPLFNIQYLATNDTKSYPGFERRRVQLVEKEKAEGNFQESRTRCERREEVSKPSGGKKRQSRAEGRSGKAERKSRAASGLHNINDVLSEAPNLGALVSTS